MMRQTTLLTRCAAALLTSALSASAAEPANAQGAPGRRGFATATVARPDRFPHRIWAATDFESPLPDYAWFGKPQITDVPNYPGNVTALLGGHDKSAATMVGMNPVPGPKMGKVNYLYCRYLLKGA